MRLTGFVFSALVMSGMALAQAAPWEPTIRLENGAVRLRPPAVPKALAESVRILETDQCVATVVGRTVQLSTACAFVQGVYLLTLPDGKSAKTVNVSFPFAVTQRGGAHTLLLDTAEVVD